MIADRPKQIFIVIFLSIGLSLLAFYFSGGVSGPTGNVVYEPQSNVIVQGNMFKAVVSDLTTDYIYSDDGSWYYSTDEINWEKRAELGTDLWSGLYYLQSADNARIFYNNTEITDLAAFATTWKVNNG